MGLRKRGWKPKSKKYDPLGIVFKTFYKAVPELERYRIGSIETTSGSKMVQGRIKGRYKADYELDVFKDGSDVIVKANVWGKKRDGIAYRVSVPVADKVARKFAIWFENKLSEIRAGEA